jgi:hypothetical protein
MWGNCGKARQVLDFAQAEFLCPISRQAAELIQINDLARIDDKSAARTRRSIGLLSKHGFWG